MNPREQRIKNFREAVRLLLPRRQDPHDAELADATGVEGGLPRKETWLWRKIVEAAERELLNPPRTPNLNHEAPVFQPPTDGWTMNPPRTPNLNHEEWFQEYFDFSAITDDRDDLGTGPGSPFSTTEKPNGTA